MGEQVAARLRKKATDRCLMNIEAGFTSDIRRKDFSSYMTDKNSVRIVP